MTEYGESEQHLSCRYSQFYPYLKLV